MERQESEWSKSIPFKEQKLIIKRMLQFAKPFKKTFFAAIFFAFLLSIVNILHLFLCGSLFLWGSHQSSHLVFSMVSILDGFLADVSICADQVIREAA